MDSQKIGKFIKELRKKNNLTQKDLADKYNVTYQAVSKWERGINMPDISLIRKMSKDFNIDIEELLDGEVKEKKLVKLDDNTKSLVYPYVFGIVGFIFIGLLTTLFFIKTDNNKPSFSFKTLSTTCKEFKVTGVIAYDSKTSSINISNIDYCGGDDKTVYDAISCELYEEEGKTKTLISKCNKDGENQKLEDYLEEVEVKVDNYEQKCKNYTDNNLYLEIKASKEKKTTVYKIDLELNTNCPKEIQDEKKEEKNESNGNKSK